MTLTYQFHQWTLSRIIMLCAPLISRDLPLVFMFDIARCIFRIGYVGFIELQQWCTHLMVSFFRFPSHLDRFSSLALCTSLFLDHLSSFIWFIYSENLYLTLRLIDPQKLYSLFLLFSIFSHLHTFEWLALDFSSLNFI